MFVASFLLLFSDAKRVVLQREKCEDITQESECEHQSACIKKKDQNGEYNACVSYEVDLFHCLTTNKKKCEPRWDKGRNAVYMQEKGSESCGYKYEKMCITERVFHKDVKGILVIMVKEGENKENPHLQCLHGWHFAFKFPKKICSSNNVDPKKIKMFVPKLRNTPLEDYNKCLVGRFKSEDPNCESYFDGESVQDCRIVKKSNHVGKRDELCEKSMLHIQKCDCSEDREYQENGQDGRKFAGEEYKEFLKDKDNHPSECEPLDKAGSIKARVRIVYDYMFYFRTTPQTAIETEQKIQNYKRISPNNSKYDVFTDLEENRMELKIRSIIKDVSYFFVNSIQIEIEPITVQPMFLRLHFLNESWKGNDNKTHKKMEDCDTPYGEKGHSLNKCDPKCAFIMRGPMGIINKFVGSNDKFKRSDTVFLTGCALPKNIAGADNNKNIVGEAFPSFCTTTNSPKIMWISMYKNNKNGEMSDPIKHIFAHELGHYYGAPHHSPPVCEEFGNKEKPILDSKSRTWFCCELEVVTSLRSKEGKCEKRTKKEEFLMEPAYGSNDFEITRIHKESKKRMCNLIMMRAIPNTIKGKLDCLEGCFCINSDGCKPKYGTRECEVDEKCKCEDKDKDTDKCKVEERKGKYYSKFACGLVRCNVEVYTRHDFWSTVKFKEGGFKAGYNFLKAGDSINFDCEKFYGRKEGRPKVECNSLGAPKFTTPCTPTNCDERTARKQIIKEVQKGWKGKGTLGENKFSNFSLEGLEYGGKSNWIYCRDIFSHPSLKKSSGGMYYSCAHPKKRENGAPLGIQISGCNGYKTVNVRNGHNTKWVETEEVWNGVTWESIPSCGDANGSGDRCNCPDNEVCTKEECASTDNDKKADTCPTTTTSTSTTTKLIGCREKIDWNDKPYECECGQGYNTDKTETCKKSSSHKSCAVYDGKCSVHDIDLSCIVQGKLLKPDSCEAEGNERSKRDCPICADLQTSRRGKRSVDLQTSSASCEEKDTVNWKGLCQDEKEYSCNDISDTNFRENCKNTCCEFAKAKSTAAATPTSTPAKRPKPTATANSQTSSRQIRSNPIRKQNEKWCLNWDLAHYCENDEEFKINCHSTCESRNTAATTSPPEPKWKEATAATTTSPPEKRTDASAGGESCGKNTNDNDDYCTEFVNKKQDCDEDVRAYCKKTCCLLDDKSGRWEWSETNNSQTSSNNSQTSSNNSQTSSRQIRSTAATTSPPATKWKEATAATTTSPPAKRTDASAGGASCDEEKNCGTAWSDHCKQLRKEGVLENHCKTDVHVKDCCR